MSEHRVRRQIVFTAEPFAFGPVSKLVAIAGECAPWADCLFVGCGTALEYASRNADHFTRIEERDGTRAILREELPPCDALVSVMEPWAVLNAARSRRPSFFVDSLHWQVASSNLVDASHVADAWRAATPQQLEALLDEPRSSRSAHAMAWRWADQLLFQGRFDVAEYTADLGRELGRSLHQIGAIVGAAPAGASVNGRPLISLSGTLSRLVPEALARKYVLLVHRLLDPHREALAGARVVGHPFSTSIMGELGWDAQPVDQHEMQAMLRDARFVLAPPGLTTALEAARAGAPLGFLPESEYSHRRNLERLGASRPGAYPAISLHSLFDLPAEPTTTDFDLVLSHLLGDDGEADLAAMRREVAWLLGVMSDLERAETMAREQRRAVLDDVVTFDGAREVAEIVMRHVS
jgi:hypothetical protein